MKTKNYKRICLLFRFYDRNKGLEIQLDKFCKENEFKHAIRWNDYGWYELELPLGDSYTRKILTKEWDRPIKAIMIQMEKYDPSIIGKIVDIYYDEKEGWDNDRI